MFCHKCGSKALENAEFCQKCGTRLIVDDATQPLSAIPVSMEMHKTIETKSFETPIAPITPVAQEPIPTQSLMSNVQTLVPKKKMSKKLLIVIAGGVIIAIIAIIIAVNWNGSTNYIATVRAWRPFGSSGINATYGQVIDRFIDQVAWEESVVGRGEASVVTKGTITLSGETHDIMLAVVVSPGATSDLASMRMGAGSLGGETFSVSEVEEFVLSMFVAFDADRDDLSVTASTPASSDVSQVSFTTYISEENGFSFSYPSDWDVSTPRTIVDIITVYDVSGASFGVSENYYLPFELSSGDESLIEASVNEIHEFVSISNTEVNGHQMKELVYISEGGIHGPTVTVNYFYDNGGMTYQIIGSFPVDESERYGSIINAILDSYIIDVLPEPPVDYTIYNGLWYLDGKEWEEGTLELELSDRYVNGYFLGTLAGRITGIRFEGMLDSEGVVESNFIDDWGGTGYLVLSLEDGLVFAHIDYYELSEYAYIDGDQVYRRENRSSRDEQESGIVNELYTGEVLYNGVPVHSLFELAVGEVFSVFGDFGELLEQRMLDEWTSAYMYSNEVVLVVNDYTAIVQGAFLHAYECEIGGVSTSLSLEREVLLSILGNPYDEFEEDAELHIVYECSDYWLTFIMNRGEAAHTVSVFTKYPI